MVAKELGSSDDVDSVLVLDSQPCSIWVIGKRIHIVVSRKDPSGDENLLDTLPPELGLSAVNSDDDTGISSKEMEPELV